MQKKITIDGKQILKNKEVLNRLEWREQQLYNSERS